MKTTLLPISILILLFASYAASAQSPFYEVKASTAPYEELQNVTWEEKNPQVDYQVPSLPGFFAFGKEMGTDMIILKDGWVLNTGPTNSFSFAPFLAYRGLYARPSGSSISAIGSIEPNQDTIIKIQWKNMGLKGNDSGDFANFQVWVSKKFQTIEFHYGPSRVTDTAAFKGFPGPAVEIMLYKVDYTKVLEVHKLVHNPANPKDTADYVGIYSQLNSAPANGTVYTFTRKSGLGVKERAENAAIAVFPNPVNSTTVFVSLNREIQNPCFTLVNTVGQTFELKSIKAQNSTYEIRLPDGLENGVYFIQVMDEEGLSHTKRIIIGN